LGQFGYNLVITSTIFPAYYVAITANQANGNRVTFFGKSFVNTALSDYALATAYMVMVLLVAHTIVYSRL
jgi:UMF1 family MFS transporter